MTNGELIRSWDDEQLAMWLFYIERLGRLNVSSPGEWLDWLQKEADE